MLKVPFVDLRAMHDEVRGQIEAAWRDIIDQSAFIGGTAVAEFESRFAQYAGAKYCVGLGSGTDAVRIALQAVGVRPGDAVVTVPHSFIATVEGITQAGASPVFVDIDPVSYTMDADLVAQYLAACKVRDGCLIDQLTGRPVTCLLPVHLYGQPANMNALRRLADHYGLRLVEDAAQAHGAEYHGQRCGGLGDAAAFSFYPGKNLGAMGEAGAVTTNRVEVAEVCRTLRDHGQSDRYVHVRSDGGNARLDAVQAVVLNAKLDHIERWTEDRRRVAQWYEEHLNKLDLLRPRAMAYARHVYHLYVVLVEGRDRVRNELGDLGIGTGLHYPIPLHLQAAYKSLGLEAGTFTVAERVAKHCLSLPMFPHLTEDQVRQVADGLRDVAAATPLAIS